MPDKCQGRYLAVCDEKVITERIKKTEDCVESKLMQCSVFFCKTKLVNKIQVLTNIIL